MIEGVVFDIDDTLYFEREYVRSGFLHVAGTIASSKAERDALFAWLWSEFERGGRGDTFDHLNAAFPAVQGRFSTSELVDEYRRHHPTISLIPGVAELLEEMQQRGFRLGALSDGPLASQEAKAAALDLANWLDPIVFTSALGPAYAKPAIAGFEMIRQLWGIDPDRLLYVGDNPLKDFAGPRRLGWHTVRLRNPSQLRYGLESRDELEGPEVEIHTIPELSALVG